MNNQDRLSEDEHYENKDDEGGLYQDSRIGFIRKVYTLVTLQLLVTAGIGYWGYNSQWFKDTFVQIVPMIILSVLVLGISIVIGCCTDVFRRYALPLFIIFTLLLSLLVAISISGYKSDSVLLAVAITMALVVALTIYACKCLAI